MTAGRRLGAAPLASGLCLGVAAASAADVWLQVVRWRQANWAMPATVLVVAGTCACLATAGAGLAAIRPDALRPWLTVLTVTLFVLAYLTVFSIGAGVLLLAIAVLLLRLRLAGRHCAVRPRVAPGLLMSFGIIPLAVLAIQRPVVECEPHGGGSSTPVWTWFGSGGGASGVRASGTSARGGETTGEVDVGGQRYRFACAAGRLIEFTRR